MRAIIFFLRHSVFKFATYFSSPSLWLIKSNFELSRLSNFFFFHLFIFLFGSSLKSFIFLLSNREMIVCDKNSFTYIVSSDKGSWSRADQISTFSMIKKKPYKNKQPWSNEFFKFRMKYSEVTKIMLLNLLKFRLSKLIFTINIVAWHAKKSTLLSYGSQTIV